MAPIINADKCTGCGTCTEVCPSDVFFQAGKKGHPQVKYPGECWHCAACVMECPIEDAIRLRLPLPQMIMYK